MACGPHNFYTIKDPTLGHRNMRGIPNRAIPVSTPVIFLLGFILFLLPWLVKPWWWRHGFPLYYKGAHPTSFLASFLFFVLSFLGKKKAFIPNKAENKHKIETASTQGHPYNKIS